MRSRQRRAVYPANDFYGSELILRRFAEWRRPIKAVIPHGVPLNPFYTHNQITGWPVPFILAYSWITEEWAAASAKHVVISAAPFVYLVDRVDPVPIPARTPPTGRRLLFFPSHSTALIASSPSSAATLHRLEELRAQGWDCTVCLYWRDLELGRSAPFAELGLRTVTCGHREDPAFTSRLVRLILESTAVGGDDFGSHMLYAAYLGRPYFSLVPPPQLRGPGTILDWYARSPEPEESRFRTQLPDGIARIYADLAGAFGGVSTTPDQRTQHALARQFLGADNVLRQEELRDVLHRAQRADLLDRHPPAGASRSPAATRQVRRAAAALQRTRRRIRRLRGRVGP